ncbi:hypothetical protein BACCAP_02239 [Pseudoflavonifractor capillosus ATCC 29799]|uniref:Uncharacterized protein n=1 Tax=Pseudoflavonifractor capillosus ATCC 29799 TaxID=411467 RepID=A6NVJ7_9FIRM|nr:hypothetical protein BACCAP_02239 [Pseudoflavonifractor capillosus ATCC 29799]
MAHAPGAKRGAEDRTKAELCLSDDKSGPNRWDFFSSAAFSAVAGMDVSQPDPPHAVTTGGAAQ